MALEAKEIEQELEDTRKAIRDTWSQMEDRADQAVERVKEGIKSTVDVKAKIRQHPVESVATAAVFGLVTGALAFRRSERHVSSRGTSLFNKAHGLFHDELNIVKGAVAATAVNQLASVVSRMVPKWQVLASELASTAAEKLADKAKEKAPARAANEGVETEFTPPAGLERKDLH